MRIALSILICTVALSTAILVSGCTTVVVEKEPPPGPVVVSKPGPPPWAPAHGYRAKYHYHYYPACSVYFDLGRKVYFYASGERWTMAAALPSGICLNFDNPAVLDMDSDRPYLWHTEVAKRYPPGQLKKMESSAKGKGKGKDKWD